ncbi:MAG: site-2 protease family protein [Candidatus Rokubacteria bacterium]|nr:site-2 protease family protein [Candidatus Rokubacteria bacterium]
MDGVATLFRLWGIPVRVHASWLVIFGLLAWSLSVGYFPHVLPDLPLVAHWANGFLAALLLFVSVLLHELSHSVAALRYGIPVSGITLHIFGGVSQLEREPDRPGVEVVVAVVGPLTSFAIAAVLALALRLLDPPAAAAAIMRYLVIVNAVVGVFNLVPGFPLDGGRLLRAALWKLKGNLHWATRMASRAGSAFAFLLMGLGVLRALAGEFLGGLWFVVIGLFLHQAAAGSYQQLLLRRALGPLAVRDVMTREVIHVPPDLTVARVVEEFFWPHHVSSFPVLDGGRVVGILSLHQLRQVPRERWETTRVRELMLPLTDSLTASPGDPLWEAFEKLSGNGLGRLAVVERGRLAGYLSIKDVAHIIAVTSGLGGPQGGRP